MHSTHLLDAPLTIMYAPPLLRSLTRPEGLLGHVLLRSYRVDERPSWLAAAGLPPLMLTGRVFDASLAIGRAVMAWAGVGLVPPTMFQGELASQRLAIPFSTEVSVGGYWLTQLQMRPDTSGMAAFRLWLLDKLTGASAP